MKMRFIATVVFILLPLTISCDATLPLDPSAQQDQSFYSVSDLDGSLNRLEPAPIYGPAEKDQQFRPGVRSGFNTRNGATIDDSLSTIYNP